MPKMCVPGPPARLGLKHGTLQGLPAFGTVLCRGCSTDCAIERWICCPALTVKEEEEEEEEGEEEEQEEEEGEGEVAPR